MNADQTEIAQAAQNAAPTGRGEMAERLIAGAQLRSLLHAQHGQQALLGRTVKEAQQAQHGDFGAAFPKVPHVGTEEMPCVVAMLGVLIEQWNLAPPPDL